MKRILKKPEILNEVGTYRFIKLHGEMTKIDIKNADAAFEAAMEIRTQRKKETEKELLIHGTSR